MPLHCLGFPCCCRQLLDKQRKCSISECVSTKEWQENETAREGKRELYVKGNRSTCSTSSFHEYPAERLQWYSKNRNNIAIPTESKPSQSKSDRWMRTLRFFRNNLTVGFDFRVELFFQVGLVIQDKWSFCHHFLDGWTTDKRIARLVHNNVSDVTDAFSRCQFQGQFG